MAMQHNEWVNLSRRQLVTQVNDLIGQHANLVFVVDSSRDEILLETDVSRLRFLQDRIRFLDFIQQQLEIVLQ